MLSTFPAAVSVNPSTGEEFARYVFQDEAAVGETLDRSQAGFGQWRKESVLKRSSILERMGAVLRANAAAYANVITCEMGKPITQARAEIEKCAGLCDWYARNAAGVCADQPTQIPNGKAYVSYLPIGPILAVMPWNFPFWQVMRGAVPIIASGNVYVLKHAPNVMGCATLIKEAWRLAGLPESVFELLNVGPEGVSTAIAHRHVAAVTVTGSGRAGSAIAAQAGAVLKKTVLELGGSDAFVVLADAPLEAAAQAAVNARFLNSGQVCLAAKRIILEAPIAQTFTNIFLGLVDALKCGDPMLADTFVGPLARKDLRDVLDRQVQSSIDKGANVVMGGHAVRGPGNYYEPTVLKDVADDMPVFNEETFGPVAALTIASDLRHAISLANRSEYGLSAALWTRDVDQAKALARELEVGGVFINGYAASDPRVPIGGVKHSGYGRELSHFGIHEFMNAQTVWVDRR